MGRQTYKRIIAYLFGLCIIIIMIVIAGPTEVLTILKQTSPKWLILSIWIYSISWFFRTWRLRIFLSRTWRKWDWINTFELHIAGFALNTFLPAKVGDIAIATYLKTKGEVDMGTMLRCWFWL